MVASIRMNWGVADDGTKMYALHSFHNVAALETDHELIAAVADHRIVVLAVMEHCGDVATTITFNSASDAISCDFDNVAYGGAVLPFNPQGWFKTEESEALTATTSAGSSTGVQLVYIIV
jgi:hypothetical protein